MWPWIVAAVAGGAAIAHFSSANSAGAQDDEVQKAVAAVLSKENDLVTLTTFALKLRAAGYDTYAAQVDAKAANIHRTSVLPFTKALFRNVPQ